MKEKLVFGLDIGTRSIVGTVGYRKLDKFVIVAQRSKEHETRAMLDGQIHDIQKVGDTIRQVKQELEDIIDEKLEGVCIAAAGRVLYTVNTHVEEELDNREVTQEDIYNLISEGVEKAYEEFLSEKKETDEIKFYCVGHSVVRYFLNGSQIGNLEGHKARKIGIDLIATFLPDEVVDSLYKAVDIAGLKVDNLTLEPIAAIQLAIPERFRMLNLALVDVGAGTSDISITNDGCILAFGMIPQAGDALTEDIAKACLVDFNEAERIKREADVKEEVEYLDIMLLPQKIKSSEVHKITEATIEEMAEKTSSKIIELNGGKSVSAVFIVGGGGKITGYAEAVANKLGIAKERVALRGEEVMQNIIFTEETKKDSLLVTPIGICLNYYEDSNNFIFVSFNGSRIKMYDNNNLTVGDVAIQAQFPKENLFPKRGEALEFKVNGKARMIRGAAGEPATVLINEEPATITTKIRSNDIIRVVDSTKGEAANATLEFLPESSEVLNFVVNGNKVTFEKIASVNGVVQSKFYPIKSGDEIEILNGCTVKQLAEFTDVILDNKMNIYVNNKLADEDTFIYDNFSVDWTYDTLKSDKDREEAKEDDLDSYEESEELEDAYENLADAEEESVEAEKTNESDSEESKANEETVTSEEKTGKKVTKSITVIVNNSPVVLNGKSNYVFVDVFDVINFNLADSKGRSIVTKINDRQAQYMEALKDNDKLEIYWKEI
ncbi:MAG: pilus assembly protein PilM [Lachnospiraceae bacterium]|nr:pilus assembly protein PilM [Lachnospiraceae bacterium]